MPEPPAALARFSLQGRAAVVTGGLGKVGGAVASALAQAGAAVTVLDRTDADWRARRAAFPAGVRFEAADAADLERIPALVARLDEALGGIDVWVNAAYPRTEDWGRPGAGDGPESWRRNVEMQMTSYCLLAEHAARAMARRGGGAIINVASIYGVVAPDFGVYEGTDMTTPGAYPAIKGGIIAHSRYLASYYGRRGVRVNALCPGGIAAGQPEAFREAYARRTAIGRMASADEMGPPAVFLASDAASYVTGIALMVDGGWTAL